MDIRDEEAVIIRLLASQSNRRAPRSRGTICRLEIPWNKEAEFNELDSFVIHSHIDHIVVGVDQSSASSSGLRLVGNKAMSWIWGVKKAETGEEVAGRVAIPECV